MKMPDEEDNKYRSIEEVRSSFYPGSASILNLERDDLLEPSISVADNRSVQVIKKIARRAADSETNLDDAGAEQDLVG